MTKSGIISKKCISVMEVSTSFLLLVLIIDPLSNRLIRLHGSVKLHLVSELLLIIIITLLTHLSYCKIGAFLLVCF